jgi:hypothetical protein
VVYTVCAAMWEADAGLPYFATVDEALASFHHLPPRTCAAGRGGG